MKYAPYSSSRMSTAVCGYLFYKSYVDPDRVKTRSLPQDRGSAVHEVLEYMTEKYKGDLDYPFFTFSGMGRPVPTSELREVIKEAVHRYPAAYQQLEVLEECAYRYSKARFEEIDESTGIELMLAVKEDGENFIQTGFDSKDAIMRGKIDLLFFSEDAVEATIVDHKTQLNMEEADTFQMSVYAWLTSKCYPFLERISSVLYFAQYGKYSDPFGWTREDIAIVEREILSRIDIIESRTNWEACPCHICQYCEFVAECPAMKDFVETDDAGRIIAKRNNLKIFGDVNKAVYVGQSIRVLETYLAEAKKELKAHVKKYGPIAIDGLAFENRSSEGIDWRKANANKANLADILRRHGADPEDYMGFSSDQTKHLAYHENEELKKEFYGSLPRKVSSTFKGYKI